MRKIYFKYFCDEGEADAFYEVVNGQLKLIASWSNNDASYRDEYMHSLFSYLGVDIQRLPKKYETQAKKLFCEAWGIV